MWTLKFPLEGFCGAEPWSDSLFMFLARALCCSLIVTISGYRSSELEFVVIQQTLAAW